MASRAIGLGTIVKVDHDADASYTTIGQIKETTPPPRERAGVEATALEDTLEQIKAGIEEESQFEFLQIWHATDSNHAIIDTLFGSKAEVNWQVIYPFTTPVTQQFAGWVRAMTPETVTKDGAIMRKVTVQRTGAITTS